MKTLITILGLVFATQISQAFVNFEVQPLTLKSNSEVIGVHTGQYGQDAIILRGYAANKVAQQAGYTIDTRREMIVVTGSEVSNLVYQAVGGLYNTGKLVLLTSAAFASAGLQLAFNTIYIGARFAFITITTAATIGKTIVYTTLRGLAYTVYMVTSTGLRVATAPFYVVARIFRFACNIPNYFGFGRLACR